jgi:hypothetical protein
MSFRTPRGHSWQRIAPTTAAIVGGAVADAGGGWGWTLSDLKTFLETGAPLATEMTA